MNDDCYTKDLKIYFFAGGHLCTKWFVSNFVEVFLLSP